VYTDRFFFHPAEKMRPGLVAHIPEMGPDCHSHYIPYGVTLTYASTVLGYAFYAGARTNMEEAARYFYFARVGTGLLTALLFAHVLLVFQRRGVATPGLLTLGVMFWSPLFVQQSFAITGDAVV
jgi:hypothetical protein